MSRHRAIVIGLGLAAVVISGLYPPWIHQVRQLAVASYGWLWSPPFDTYGYYAIDWQRLLLTWAIIAAATTGLFILMPYLAKSRHET